MESLTISNPAKNSTVTLTGRNLPYAFAAVSEESYSLIEEAYAMVYFSNQTPPLTPPTGAVAGTISFPYVQFASLACPGNNSSDSYKIAVWVTVDEGEDLMDYNTFTGNT